MFISSKICKICKNDVVQLHPHNNEVDDRGLYSRGQQWLKREDIVGRAKAYVYLFKIIKFVKNNVVQLHP